MAAPLKLPARARQPCRGPGAALSPAQPVGPEDVQMPSGRCFKNGTRKSVYEQCKQSASSTYPFVRC